MALSEIYMSSLVEQPAQPVRPPGLELKNITKRFPGVLANDSANLSVGVGEVHAILGENGAGKSTLMRILYGVYQPDSGSICINGNQMYFGSQRQAIQHGVGMIHQEFMLVRQMTVVENLILGLDSEPGLPLQLHEAARRIDELSREHGLEVDPWAKVEDLPVGVQQRVEILKLLYRNAKVLVLDEPTAILTPGEAQSLLKTLRHLASRGCAIIIVTHKLHEVMNGTDRVTIMRDGATVDVLETAETSAAELARIMVGRDVVQSVDKSLARPGEVVMQARRLCVADSKGGLAVDAFDLQVRGGEIVGLAGVDGNGQSQLVEALMGLRETNSGTVSMNDVDITRSTPLERNAHGLSYVPADRRHVGAITDLGIHENAVLGKHHEFTTGSGWFRDIRRSREHAETLVARFQVKTPHIRFPAGKLSGGNLQKLILGREIMGDPHVLIVEQPTRGLDVGAIEYVWKELLSLREQGKGMLLLSAELDEIINLSDRILVMHGGRIMGELTPEQATDERIGLLMAGVPEAGFSGTMTREAVL